MATMCCLYACGAKFIENLQYTLSDYECYFELVNNLSSPYMGYEVLVPIVSVFDSVYASQLILCIAFTGWLVNVIKWWLQEDRPYRWVRNNRPCGRRCPGVSRSQPRKSGPGFPSGHSAAAAVEVALLINWIERLVVDRDITGETWRYFAYPMAAVAICSTMLARMYVAAHFPHQVVFGATLGLLLTPYLCVYVANPTIWGPHHFDEAATRRWHVLGAVAVTGISVITAQNLALCGGYQPAESDMGCQPCGDPDKNPVPATPMGTLTRYTGSLFGWALAVTPIVQRYRHFTKNRSVVLSFMATIIINKIISEFMKRLDELECQESYYVIKFCVNILKPIFYLRLIPLLAMYPYDDEGFDLDKKQEPIPDQYYTKKQNSKKGKK